MEQNLDNSPSYERLASDCCSMAITIEAIRKLVNGTQPTIANIDYTAAILDEFHKCHSEGMFRKPYFDMMEVAVRLNSAIKASQNCA